MRLLRASGALLACGAILVSARVVEAVPVIAYQVPADTVGNQEPGASLGLDFDVVRDIVVTRLGVFDSASDGIFLPLTAAVYNRDTGVAFSAVLQFTEADPGDLVEGSRFKALAEPLTLPAGFHGSIVAEGYGAEELVGNQGRGPLTLSTDDGNCSINFVGGGRWGDVGTYPSNPDQGPANIYAAGTFEFEAPDPLPEPGTPTNVTAVRGDGIVEVSWQDKFCGTPAASYKVYRGYSTAGPFAQVGQVTETHHTDLLPNQTRACYLVRAVAAGGAESGESEKACTPATLGVPPCGYGDPVASDNASDPDYADDWQALNESVPEEMGNDDGGIGFLPWDFGNYFGDGGPLLFDTANSPYLQPHFIDRGPSEFNDLGAPAFALTNSNVAYTGYTAIAQRPFAEPLSPGQRFSVDIDNPKMFWQPGGDCDYTGFIVTFRTADNVERFALFTFKSTVACFGYDSDDWLITDSRGGTPSGLTATEGSSGFCLAFWLTGDETYHLTLTPRAGGPVRVFEGSLASPGGGEITRVAFVMYRNGSGDGADEPSGEHEFYFNNLAITSIEPNQKPVDMNQDAAFNISDPIEILNYLFSGTVPRLPCGDGSITDVANLMLLDTNGDQQINLSDPVFALGFLFGGQGSAPVPCAGDINCPCVIIAGCPDLSADCR